MRRHDVDERGARVTFRRGISFECPSELLARLIRASYARIHIRAYIDTKIVVTILPFVVNE